MPFALFVDVLGTGQVMTSLPDDYVFPKESWREPKWRTGKFRDGLRWGAERAQDSLLLCALFSDCGYIIADSPLEILHAVRVAMWHFKSNLPVRGGVGFGNFGIDQTSHHWSGAGAFTEASFFGSALVRAHRAESCGHKGFRIFVHESAVDALTRQQEGILVFPEDTAIRDEEYTHPPPVPGTGVAIPNSPYDDVAHEVCCIGDDDIEDWYRATDILEEQYSPLASARIHYIETRNALDRFNRLRTGG
jgi:hypothetical protein